MQASRQDRVEDRGDPEGAGHGGNDPRTVLQIERSPVPGAPRSARKTGGKEGKKMKRNEAAYSFTYTLTTSSRNTNESRIEMSLAGTLLDPVCLLDIENPSRGWIRRDSNERAVSRVSTIY